VTSRRRRKGRRTRQAPGTSPGAFEIGVETAADAPAITVVDYDESYLLVTQDESRPRRPTRSGNRWIHVQGPPSLPLLEHLRVEFDLDPLALEDVVSVHQRPTFNEYDHWRFLTLSVPATAGDGFDELCLFFHDDVVISFFAGEPTLFDPLRKRLERVQGNMRRNNAIYFVYAVLDLVIDLLFPYLERFGERIEALEEEVLDRPRRETLAAVHDVRNRLLAARRMVWATREVVSTFLRALNTRGGEDRHLLPFVQDCYEHVLSAVDLIETHREMATSLVEVYLSAVSNKLNDAMRMLTVIATLFIPPTFVVGIYGMNFDRDAGPLSMPELSWPLGYVGVMSLIAVMMVSMYVYFKRKRWI
jgi:magnesium transporter